MGTHFLSFSSLPFLSFLTRTPTHSDQPEEGQQDCGREADGQVINYMHVAQQSIVDLQHYRKKWKE